jgi:hypothetical protein
MREGIVEKKQDGVRVAITSTTFDAKLCLYRSYGDVLREGDRGDWISQDFSDLRLWQAYVFFSLLYLPTVLKLGALTFLSLYLVLRRAAPPHSCLSLQKPAQDMFLMGYLLPIALLG